jgi:hypothetical protein
MIYMLTWEIVLFCRRVLSISAAREEKNQRHDIFHTHGTIKNKMCRIIVDNDNCNNIASSKLVERLGLKQKRYPKSLRPYKMQWLNIVARYE